MAASLRASIRWAPGSVASRQSPKGGQHQCPEQERAPDELLRAADLPPDVHGKHRRSLPGCSWTHEHEGTGAPCHLGSRGRGCQRPAGAVSSPGLRPVTSLRCGPGHASSQSSKRASGADKRRLRRSIGQHSTNVSHAQLCTGRATDPAARRGPTSTRRPKTRRRTWLAPFAGLAAPARQPTSPPGTGPR